MIFGRNVAIETGGVCCENVCINIKITFLPNFNIKISIKGHELTFGSMLGEQEDVFGGL